MNTSTSQSTRAFTLIELLTVIAIVAVLAAILIPIIGTVRRNANAAHGVSNLRQIGVAFRLFAAENNNTYPAGTIKKADWNELHPDNEVGGDQMWTKQLRSYLPQKSQSLTGRENQVFVCPNAVYLDGSGNEYEIDNIARTYSASEAIFGEENGTTSYKVSRNLLSFNAPAKTILVIDTKQSGTASASTSIVQWSRARADIAASGSDSTAYLDFRQPGTGMNTLYADGHVDTLSFEGITKVKQENWIGREL